MAFRKSVFAIALVVAGCSTSRVSSFQHCIVEDVYSSSCVNRTDTIPTGAHLCATSLTSEVLDRKAGLVAFSLLLPFNEPNSSTDITILSLQSSRSGKCSSEVEGVHSRFSLLVDENGLKHRANGSHIVSCKPNQVKKVEWKTNYMFTGCYQIYASLNYDCRSEPFRIESDFIKDVFADLRLPLLTTFKGNNVRLIISSEQLKNDCNNPRLTSSCLCLSLYKTRIEGQGGSNWKWERMVYANHAMEKSHRDGDPVSHCQWFRQEHKELVDCSCTWTEGSLECEFVDVPAGSYALELDIMDTRCNRGTIWTKNWENKDEEPCLWKHDIIVKNNTGNLWPFGVVTVQSFSSPWLISIVALTAVAIFISVCWRYNWKRSKTLLPKFLPAAEEDGDVLKKLIDPPKVLMLYARDCEPFMSVMAEIRRLLRVNLNAKVYDIWEDQTRDTIDTMGDVWTAKYLHADNVRVVLVATPISRRIESAVITGQDIRYDSPDNRDETFFFAFKTAISLAPKTIEPCNKFIVVRLNHNNCSEDILMTFSTNSTVYTLPTHLHKLILHLIQSRSVNVPLDLKNVEMLQDKIELYKKFISTHPAYVNELLDSVENCIAAGGS